jgi:enamine deaminase RidA (YjgF/YER057c/UK114 family)
VTPEARLDQLGLVLPPPWEPGATLEMCVPEGDLLYLSGHMAIDMSRVITFHGRDNHHPLMQGRVGVDLDLSSALEAARGGALNLIATLKAQLGELSRVRRILKTVVFVNAGEGCTDIHKAADASSDLLVEIFGDVGRHARTTVGVRGLPADSCLAIEAIVAFDTPGS